MQKYNNNLKIIIIVLLSDKIIDFANKFKNIKIPYLPKLKLIRISPNNFNDVDGDKTLMWAYKL